MKKKIVQTKTSIELSLINVQMRYEKYLSENKWPVFEKFVSIVVFESCKIVFSGKSWISLISKILAFIEASCQNRSSKTTSMWLFFALAFTLKTPFWDIRPSSTAWGLTISDTCNNKIIHEYNHNYNNFYKVHSLWRLPIRAGVFLN